MKLPYEMVVLPRKVIEIDPDRNARRTIYRRPIEELKANISQLGLLQPVGVRPTERGKYLLVWGYRRMRALDELEWDAIPVVIVDVDEARAYDMMLAENVIRQDVPAWDLGAMVVMLKRKGMSDDQLTERLCVALDRSFTVERLLRLGRTVLGLIPELLELWKKNTAEFDENAAYTASQMDGDAQFDLLVELTGTSKPAMPPPPGPGDKPRGKGRPKPKTIERAYQSLKAHDRDDHDDGYQTDAERAAARNVLRWVLGATGKCPVNLRKKKPQPKKEES